jgi:adiponectin receptor
VAEQAGDICRKVIEASWKVCHFQALPHWLQDNDYLIWGHRPPLPSFTACFQSLFRIHTETGNIWTHLIGCVAFVSLAVYTLIWSELQTEERLVFAAFFAGAILCLGLSCTYHTVHCHSEFVGKLFSKLDYVGISFLILGSLVPWLYYTFYCQYQPKVIYLTVATVLGFGAITTSMLDQFGEPKYRPFRAGTHFSHVIMFDQYFMTLIFFFLHIRDFHRFWIEWSHSGCSLRCNGRLGERRFLRLSRMAYSHGIALHSGSPPVRWPYTRMLFPWEM